MKKKFLFVFLLFSTRIIQAQDSVKTTKSISQNQLFESSHISFSILPYVAQKAKIKSEQGSYSPGSDLMSGIEAGAEYRFNLSKEYSIISGVHGGLSSRDYTLNISKNDFSLPLQEDINVGAAQSRHSDFYLSVPVWFERRWQCKNNSHWSVMAGINARFYFGTLREEIGAYGYHVNEQPLRVFNMNLKVGNNDVPWINYNAGIGYSFLLHNRNFLSVNLLANMSDFKLVKGSYTINVTSKEISSGSYSANLSYVGLGVNYVLKRTKNSLGLHKEN